MKSVTSAVSATQAKPVLHVECCTRVVRDESQTYLSEEVVNWLRRNFASLQLEQTFTTFPQLKVSDEVEFLTIVDITGGTESSSIISLAEVDIEVDVFQLHTDAAEPLQTLGAGPSDCDTSAIGDSEDPQAKVTLLPNKSFHGIWESLIFEDPIHFRLLRFCLRMISFTSYNSQSISWNRTILLHGPSGTGKTSLCRALAQQLSKRLCRKYPLCKLVEFDAHSLFSKFFSESGKLVSSLFGKIEVMLEEDDDTFVCLFIDEIESLAVARQYSTSSNEPRDSLRARITTAVNALLIALDRLRARSNVLILCTSNLIKAMDPAFLDRVDIKQLIPEPCIQVRYEIYRRTYLELSKYSIIAPLHRFAASDDGVQQGDMECGSPLTLVDEDGSRVVVNDDILPSRETMPVYLGSSEDSLARKLWAAAEKSTSFSGRALRRLPMLALALYTRTDSCSIGEAIDALSLAVDNEKSIKALID